MIKFEVDKIYFGLPQSWSEITYNQWQQLKVAESTEEVIKVLSGVSIEQIKAWGQSFIMQVAPFLMWMNNQVDVKEWQTPDKFMGVDVPKDIKVFSFGQKINFEQLMMDEHKKTGDVNNVLDKCIAIYMQPLVQRCEYDYDKAMEFSKEVGDQKFCEVYPVGGFFLSRSKR